MKLIILIAFTLSSLTLCAQSKSLPSILQGLPTIPWSGLKENPMISQEKADNKYDIDYLWTHELWFITASGETKYRVIIKFKQTDGQKDTETMVNELFVHLIEYTNCSKVNDNLYSLNIGGFMKRVQSNKGLVFLIISKSDFFDNKQEYNDLIKSTYLTF